MKCISQEAPWYKPRGYAHIDYPVKLDRAIKLINRFKSNPRLHGFLPLIAYEMEEVRYKRTATGYEKSIKSRPIAYTGHADAVVYSYYAYELNRIYESLLEREGLSPSILAYRTSLIGKCNLHFAIEAFSEIQNRKRCIVGTYDIKGFFDSLNHNMLYEKWISILNVQLLPEDHFTVFKAITRCRKLDRNKLLVALGISDSQFRKVRYLRRTRNHIFHMKEIRTILKDKSIYLDSINLGIPQGTPISAILSTIYMIDFDRKMIELCKQCNASYRRYSDDILLICSPDSFECISEQLSRCTKDAHLSLATDKTQITEFGCDADGRIYTNDKPVQYLGLTFDGKRALIRNKSVSRYYRMMKKAVNSAGRAAKAAKFRNEPAIIRKRKLHKKYTHLGRQTFVRYAQRASSIAKNYNIDFKMQLGRHLTVLNNLLSKKQRRVYLAKRSPKKNINITTP